MAHLTGNFVTLGATVVFGTQGVVGKLIALPEFVLVVARVIGSVLRRRGLDALRMLPATSMRGDPRSNDQGAAIFDEQSFG